ncbi:hypothetical protein COW81_02605 [Candidatus Campbellbacteria bacterium CG22_combo_CG10-13_8_21_14_all_36_13]|uniref:Phosphoribosyltransferase domain-containing protein n=1 Tax=Candidatus Campbellbacteria bacterium CG22_combo_CG10-13_8_21_14_all_36_13 TaxID=1974529 RepID=A0A2H0DZ54_9BACT|nr:MAG: hypothetical protein COW81_02605 [Candidatus Campbellbacteria bacterium CG22_combo_CG10-13_8_21_14_all_36_13]
MFTILKTFLLDTLFPRNSFEKKISEIDLDTFIKESGRFSIKEWRGITYFFDYSNIFVRNSIHSLKYKRNKKIALLYGEIIFDYLMGELYEETHTTKNDKTIITIIPSSKKRLQNRGWNQCELILSEIKKLDTNNYFEYSTRNLIKTKNTESQTRMRNKKEREKNVYGSFSIIKPEVFFKKTVILIDDVTTTGSTIKEAGKIIKNTGAKEVRLITFAH